jgi:ABC-2 type transport system permease protein
MASTPIISTRCVIAIARRYLLRTFRSFRSIIISVVTPLIILFFFGPAINNIASIPVDSGTSSANSAAPLSYIDFLVPGIIAMTLFYSSMFSASGAVQSDKITHFDDIITMSPNSSQSVILGYCLGGFIHALVDLIIVSIITLLFSFPPLDFGVFIYNLLATALTVGIFLLFGIFIAKLVDWEKFNLIVSLLTMPIVYLSSIFAPFDSFGALKLGVALNPITIVLDGYRFLILNTSMWNSVFNQNLSYWALLIDFSILLLYFLIMLKICLILFNKSALPQNHEGKFQQWKKQRKTKTKSNKEKTHDLYLEQTEDVYMDIVKKLGKENLNIIFRKIAEGKKSEALKIFKQYLSPDEIKTLITKMDVPIDGNKESL